MAEVDGAAAAVVVGNGENSIRDSLHDYDVYRQNLTINCHHWGIKTFGIRLLSDGAASKVPGKENIAAIF